MANPKSNGSTKLPEFVTNPTAADFLAGVLAEVVEQRTREAQENGDARARAFELRTLSRAAAGQQRLATALLDADEED